MARAKRGPREGELAAAVAEALRLIAEYGRLRPDLSPHRTHEDGSTTWFLLPEQFRQAAESRALDVGEAASAAEVREFSAELRAAYPGEAELVTRERSEAAERAAWESQAYEVPYPAGIGRRRFDGRLVWLYHGTTSAHLARILRDGIRPDVPKRLRVETSRGRLFLTAHAGGRLRSGGDPGATMYAQRAAHRFGGDPVVLRVIVPWNDVEPDSDDADLSCADYQFESRKRVYPEQIMEVDEVRRRGPIGAAEPWRVGYVGPRDRRR